MLRFIYWSLCTVLVLASCRPAKKVQTIQQAIDKKDTSSAVVVAAVSKVDSAAMVKDILQKVGQHKIDFNTFSAKVKVDFEGKDESGEATANIRMRKDSIIWVSLSLLGIEGMRVRITPDSVVLMNMRKKYVQRRSINYLQEITQIPFDFSTLQDIIIGNPVYTDSNVVSYKFNDNSELLVLMVGDLFKHLVTLDNTNLRVMHSKLDDVDPMRNRTCDITFTDYETNGNIMFATQRKISVAEKSKLDIDLRFKQYSFNPELTFPFNIPKNFKRQ